MKPLKNETTTFWLGMNRIHKGEKYSYARPTVVCWFDHDQAPKMPCPCTSFSYGSDKKKIRELGEWLVKASKEMEP